MAASTRGGSGAVLATTAAVAVVGASAALWWASRSRRSPGGGDVVDGGGDDDAAAAAAASKDFAAAAAVVDAATAAEVAAATAAALAHEEATASSANTAPPEPKGAPAEDPSHHASVAMSRLAATGAVGAASAAAAAAAAVADASSSAPSSVLLSQLDHGATGTVSLAERARGVLTGTGVGDAFGIPFELCDRARIVALCAAAGVPAEYGTEADAMAATVPLLDAMSTPHEMIVEAVREEGVSFGPGSITDDTQLSLALVEGLVDAGSTASAAVSLSPPPEAVDALMTNVATRFARAAKATTVGWGGGTRKAAMRLDDGTGDGGDKTTWSQSGNAGSTGDGVVMKAAPLALWIAAHPSARDTPAVLAAAARATGEALATMTHANGLCRATAAFHVRMIAWVLAVFWDAPLAREGDPLRETAARRDLLAAAVRVAGEEEAHFGVTAESASELKTQLPAGTSPLLSVRLAELLRVFEETQATAAAASATGAASVAASVLAGASPTSDRSTAAAAAPSIPDSELLRIANGGTYFVVDALTLVWGIIAARGLNQATALHVALLGGDADTTAAMVGAILGAVRGDRAINQHIVARLTVRTDIDAAAGLFAALLRSADAGDDGE